MLREHKDIDRHSHWSDCKKKLETDWRYRVVESASTREDWFRDYVRLLKDERKKEKEKDKDHRHREKDHKTDKKDRDRKDSDKGKETKSSKDKSDKDNIREKKQRKSEISTEESEKEKKEMVIEKEIGEIEESDDKSIRKENDVSMINNICLLFLYLLYNFLLNFFYFRRKREMIIPIQRRIVRNRKGNVKDERKSVSEREKEKCKGL